MVLLLWGQERFGETQWENCRVPEVAEGCGICIFSETTYFSIWCDFTIKWHLQNDLGLKPGSDPWCFFSRQTLDALLVTWRDGLFATHAGNPFISDIIRLKSTKTRFCKGGIKGWHGLAMFWGPQEVFGSIEQWCSKWRGADLFLVAQTDPKTFVFQERKLMLLTLTIQYCWENHVFPFWAFFGFCFPVSLLFCFCFSAVLPASAFMFFYFSASPLFCVSAFVFPCFVASLLLHCSASLLLCFSTVLLVCFFLALLLLKPK